MGALVEAILISAAGSILATLAWVYRGALYEAIRGRSRKVSGAWTGIARYGPPPPHERPFSCRLHQVGHLVYGTLTSLGERPTEYTVRGAVMETEYLHLTVRNTDRNVINYATAVLRIDHSSRHLDGYLVGRSRTLDLMVSGEVKMEKT